MRSRCALFAQAVGLCLHVALAQSGGIDVLPVPRTALDSMDPAVRKLLGEARSVLDGVVADPDSARQRLAEAYGGMGQLYLAYDLDDAAIAALDNATRLAPEKFDWAYYLAVAYQGRGDPEAAETMLLRAKEIKRDDPATLLRLGAVQLDLNRLHAARTNFAEARDLDPDGPMGVAGRYGMGLVLAAQRAFEPAIQHFERVLAAQPDASIVHYPLGVAYREVGRLDDAKAQLLLRGETPVRFADPLVDHLRSLAAGAGVHIARGRDAVRQGRVQAALEAFRAALAEDPENVAARQELASQLLATGDAAGAESEYRKILQLSPEDALAHYNLATALAARGLDEDAVAHYRAAVRSAPDFIEARFNLGNALVREENCDEAVDHFRRVVELDPESRRARRQLAGCLDALGQEEQAAVELRRLVAQDPSSGEAHLRLGSVLARQRNLDEAAGELALALKLELEPRRRALALGTLGDVAREQGNAAAAARHYRDALELAPDFLEARYRLAGALLAEDRYDSAAEEFATLIESRPDFEPAHRGRALALLRAERYDDARAAFEDGLRALPRSIRLAHDMTRFLATSPVAATRDGPRALELALSIARRESTPEHAQTVAMAYAEVGRFDDAVAWQERVLAEAGRAGRKDLVPTLRNRLELYRDHKPCRAPWLDPTPSDRGATEGSEDP